MLNRDYTRLLSQLADEYTRHAPRSAELNRRASKVMVDGGSHALRLIQPFPPRLASAAGAYVTDEDGHQILDFWQGHMANLLGYNPSVITGPLAAAMAEGWGLQTGFADAVQVEAAELLCQMTGAERCRFTTSGTLATMYATMLARAYTGRSLVLKVGGGWHGAQPFGLKGVAFSPESGFDGLDSAGLSPAAEGEVLVTRFNDPQRLADDFRQFGERLACFIVEPFVGGGGAIAADPEYLRVARDLCDHYGVLLVSDEIIAGFRFRAGDTFRMYGVQPDLATFGKIMGGGMPVTAVAGRAAILELAGRAGGNRVKFSGGTYSAHPLSMLATRTMLSYLAQHGADIYPGLAQRGERLRRSIEAAFRSEGAYAVCTGDGNAILPPASIVQVHFPYADGACIRRPDDALDPHLCDVVLADRVLRLALLVRDIHTVHGVGGLSTAHGDQDVDRAVAGFAEVARVVRPYLK